MKYSRLALFLVVAAMLALSACVPSEAEVPQTGIDGTPIDVPQAAQRAQDELARMLNISPDEINVASIEQMEFTDSCLGLGGPNEMCAQVMTTGWRVVLTVDGQEYVFHTDMVGDIVRSASQTGLLPTP